jgi:L,D-peptidoglycan transpeptidase YkuD (ErfK/YbiS/YcfS/YnhG family)
VTGVQTCALPIYITPKGVFKITKIYYRPDKVKKIFTRIKTIIIKKDMGWCDDPKSIFYNKQIKLPTKFSHEKLHRDDNLYDLILVLNYNTKPIIKNKGSAIFIHVAKSYYKKTKGCISLKKKDLIKLISNIRKNTKIKIN